ncbi:unnamed protein product [Dibothriocephalus latus]|uniref:Sortilin C-terminal domain-containing protein n=1 Tax=Dibothriocephalus latus TaxID=60516 RepID=A0A3P6TLK0_DIBLA|nr:unnamed protein product [Dibothriocephalus latus]
MTSQRQPEKGDRNTPNDAAAATADIGTPAPTRIPSESDETVVFTGLVTEPGGQAMTVAVYGYGTVSQRWRVAVVDFSTNGIISRNCELNLLKNVSQIKLIIKDVKCTGVVDLPTGGTAEDYEVWSPHEIPAKGDAPDNGCLLGMKEFFYRLKENAL